MVMKSLRRYLIAGLTVFLPLLLTVYVLILTFNFIDGFLGKFLKPICLAFLGFYFRGLSIAVFILLLVLIGFLVTNFLGRRLYPFIERLILRLPFFRQVYPAMKEIAIFLFSRDKPTFKQVVLIEYPRKGVYAVGFLMNDSLATLSDITKENLCSVLIPSSPSPFSGFVVLVPK